MIGGLLSFLVFLALCAVLLVLVVFGACLLREAVREVRSMDWRAPPGPVREIPADLLRLLSAAARATRRILRL